MKYLFFLFVELAVIWVLWSGHWDDPFLLGLGLLSVLFSLWVCQRMRIVDEETIPLHLGPRGIRYGLYLVWEIVKSNVQVARIILSPDMHLQRNLLEVPLNQKTALGKVILANSITLTPGTVSVSMDEDRVLVHALNFEGAQEDLAGAMEAEVARLEGN